MVNAAELNIGGTNYNIKDTQTLALVETVVDVLAWDNNFDESGYIDGGADAPGSNFVRTSKYYGCSGWDCVYVRHENTQNVFTIAFYNSSKVFLGNKVADTDMSFVPPAGAAYYRVYKTASVTGENYISEKYPSVPVDYSHNILKDGSFFNLLEANFYGNNQFDNNFDQSGYYNSGAPADSSSFKRTSHFYQCRGWGSAYVRHENAVGVFYLVFYTAAKVFIKNQTADEDVVVEVPENAEYFRIYTNASTSGGTYISFIPPSDPVDYSFELVNTIRGKNANVERWEFMQLKSRTAGSNDRTVVNFGDSVIGNIDGVSSVTGFLASFSGYNCINVGFGGCQMSKHSDPKWAAFSMCSLADAIVSGNWSSQDAVIADPPTGMPSYFSSRLERLKAIDFSDVYMITIEYGTNDWSSDATPVDNQSDQFDDTTFAGALRYTIHTLQTEYPGLIIVVQNPTPRIYMNGSTPVETSDIKQNQLGKTLVDYINAENDVCKQFKIPAIDAYYESGFNYYNHDYYYDSNSDNVHLSEAGRKRLGMIIASYLLSHFK